MSPLLGWGDLATTAPYGQVEEPFDLCGLAEAAGATFVARGTAADIEPMEDLMRLGIQHKGFSFIEAVVPCPTEYGKRNASGGVLAMLDDERARSVSVEEARRMKPEELGDKIVTGILRHDPNRPEYQRSYAAIVERAQAEAARETGQEEAG